MQTIDRETLQRKIEDSDVTVVETLGKEYFRKFHLPGAINVPLDDDFDKKIEQAVPDKEQAVVVYCFDADCQSSVKAANRMEDLGYQNVYYYEEGKTAWKEAGLPVE